MTRSITDSLLLFVLSLGSSLCLMAQSPSADTFQLAIELESLRHALSVEPTTIYAEDLKLLEDAENAAKKHDQTKLQRYVEKISEGTWEFAKSTGMEVGKQALIAFLKAHGISLP